MPALVRLDPRHFQADAVGVRRATPGDEQVLEAFRPLIDYQAHRGAGYRAALYEQVLRAIAIHRVADRPDRFEPRMAKRRPKRYDRLTKPRREIKLQMLKGVVKI